MFLVKSVVCVADGRFFMTEGVYEEALADECLSNKLTRLDAFSVYNPDNPCVWCETQVVALP